MTFRQELIALLKRIGVTYDPALFAPTGRERSTCVSPLTGLWGNTGLVNPAFCTLGYGSAAPWRARDTHRDHRVMRFVRCMF